MVISQDSLAPDAGSVVFHACFMPIMNQATYKRFRDKHNLEKFRSWAIAKRFLSAVATLDRIYLTDASKVYRKMSWKDGDFDVQLSKRLLEEEIEICSPRLIVLLGSTPMALLRFQEKFADVVGREILSKGNKDIIVAPFPSVANATFKRRAVETLRLVKSYWSPK